MKKWIFLATLFLGTSVYAQVDSAVAVATQAVVEAQVVDNGALKTEIKSEVKKELVSEVNAVVSKMESANKKEAEELKFKIKELEAKMAKEIETNEKQKFQDELKEASKIKISGLASFASKSDLNYMTKGDNETSTSDNYFTARALVDFEAQITNEVRANVRIASDGADNYITLTGEDGLISRPKVVVDHAYMTVDFGLSSNKAGLIYQGASAAKNVYYAATSIGDGAYLSTGYYADDLRNTLVGVRTELSFDKVAGLNLTVAKNENKGPKITENDVVTSHTNDLLTLIAEIPLQLGEVKVVPEGLIGIEDSMKSIAAGVDIIIPTTVMEIGVFGAGSFTKGVDTKNGMAGVYLSIPLKESKSFSFIPYVGYKATGETQDNFSKESLLIQHNFEVKFPLTYKQFTLTPKYSTNIRPNADVTMIGGGEDFFGNTFEFDFTVNF